MVDLKGKSWMLIAIAGIFTILLTIIPSFIFIESDSGNGMIFFLFGILIMDLDAGKISDIELIDHNSYVALGVLFFVIILIIGIILVLIVILPKIGREIPYKGQILLLLGIFLLLLPTLHHTAWHVVGDIIDYAYWDLLGVNFDSLLLFPIAGILIIIPGIQELAK